jgi:hypothetical protein
MGVYIRGYREGEFVNEVHWACTSFFDQGIEEIIDSFLD